jgi:hypothetical protein
MESLFREEHVSYEVHTWTETSKAAAVETLRAWLRDRTLILPEHEQMRRELHQFEERITRGGRFTFAARGSGRDDYVSLLITLTMACIAGRLRAVHVPDGRPVGWLGHYQPCVRGLDIPFDDNFERF